MTDLELGYMAGIFDGEGSLSITSRPEGKGYKSPSHNMYGLSIQVSMKNRHVVEWIHNNFGGNAYRYRQNGGAFGKGFISVWSMTGSQAHNFLGLIVNLLIEKREQATIALKFPLLDYGHNYGVTNHMQEVRESTYTELKDQKDMEREYNIDS